MSESESPCFRRSVLRSFDYLDSLLDIIQMLPLFSGADTRRRERSDSWCRASLAVPFLSARCRQHQYHTHIFKTTYKPPEAQKVLFFLGVSEA